MLIKFSHKYLSLLIVGVLNKPTFQCILMIGTFRLSELWSCVNSRRAAQHSAVARSNKRARQFYLILWLVLFYFKHLCHSQLYLIKLSCERSRNEYIISASKGKHHNGLIIFCYNNKLNQQERCNNNASIVVLRQFWTGHSFLSLFSCESHALEGRKNTASINDKQIGKNEFPARPLQHSSSLWTHTFDRQTETNNVCLNFIVRWKRFVKKIFQYVVHYLRLLCICLSIITPISPMKFWKKFTVAIRITWMPLAKYPLGFQGIVFKSKNVFLWRKIYFSRIYATFHLISYNIPRFPVILEHFHDKLAVCKLLIIIPAESLR